MKCEKCDCLRTSDAPFCSQCGHQFTTEFVAPETSVDDAGNTSVETPVKVEEQPDSPEPFKPSKVPHASILRRWIALTLDFSILSIAIRTMKYIGDSQFAEKDYWGNYELSQVGAISYIAAFFVIQLTYFTFFEQSKYQATFGKTMLRLRVVSKIGERLSLKNSLKRNLFKVLFSWICAVGYIKAFFSHHNRTLHDSAASTYVLDDFELLQLQIPSNRRALIKSDPEARRKSISKRFK